MSAAAESAHSVAPAPVEASAVLAALPYPVVVLDGHGVVAEANAAAETFFAASRRRLIGRELAALLPVASPLMALIDEIKQRKSRSTAHGLDLSTPLAGRHAHRSMPSSRPFGEDDGRLIVTLIERAIAAMMERQMTHRSAARALDGPLGRACARDQEPALGHSRRRTASGNRRQRGGARADASHLRRDRSHLPPRRSHAGVRHRRDCSRARRSTSTRCSSHVRQLARSGLRARASASSSVYDPSLPPVSGNRDRLVQALLNLVKNAAEAVAATADARITCRPPTARACAIKPPAARQPREPAAHRRHRGQRSGRAGELCGRTSSIRSSAPRPAAAASASPSSPRSSRSTAASSSSTSAPGRTIFRIALPIGEDRHEQGHNPRRRRRRGDPHGAEPGAGARGLHSARHRQCGDALALGRRGRGRSRRHRRRHAGCQRLRSHSAHQEGAARTCRSSS